MFNEKREFLHQKYNLALTYFDAHPDELIEIEHYITNIINKEIQDNLEEIKNDYNEASYLNALWKNYPPEDRGRAPKGDQIPWIEVGEHSVGHKLERIIGTKYKISEIGLPSGADNRFVIFSKEITNITKGFIDCAFVFLDIKSVGPRDNFEHTVISPYQVSGNGIWNSPENNLINDPIIAKGARATHTFYPAISPIYPLTNGHIAPAVHLFVKPVYKMLSDNKNGQPLDYIKNICMPNGILMCKNPNYIKKYPGLFFPGKDDKKKDPKKIRVRVSFEILSKIATWRVQEFR